MSQTMDSIRSNEARHAGQIGTRRESTSSSPQMRQSAGKITLTSASLAEVNQERSPPPRPCLLPGAPGMEEIALDGPASATAKECTRFLALIKERNYAKVIEEKGGAG